MDGCDEIIIDENKQLVVTEGLRRLFDYFLSALGEEDRSRHLCSLESFQYPKSHARTSGKPSGNYI